MSSSKQSPPHHVIRIPSIRERLELGKDDGRDSERDFKATQAPQPEHGEEQPSKIATSNTPFQAYNSLSSPLPHISPMQREVSPQHHHDDSQNDNDVEPPPTKPLSSPVGSEGSVTGEAITITEPLPPGAAPSSIRDECRNPPHGPPSQSQSSTKKQLACLLSKLKEGKDKLLRPFASPEPTQSHPHTASSDGHADICESPPEFSDDEEEMDIQHNNNRDRRGLSPTKSAFTISSKEKSAAESSEQPPIPRTPKDITVNYLNSVLHLPSLIERVRVEVPNVPGLLCVLVRVNILEYTDKEAHKHLPESLIVKISPRMAHTSDITEAGDLFRRECLCYGHLSAQQKDKTHFLPHLYYGHCDTRQRFILIMEDCSKPNRTILTETISTHAEAVMIIQDLARFQAQFWHKISPSNACSYKWKGVLYGNDDEFFKELGLGWLPENFSLTYHTHFFEKLSEWKEEHKLYFWARYSQKNSSELCYRFFQSWKSLGVWIKGIKNTRQLGKKYQFARLYQDIDKLDVEESFHVALTECNSSRAPRTIVHGDYRLDNIVMRKHRMKICAVDWHYASVGNGFLDLADFLVNSVSIDDSEKYGTEYLQVYIDTLVENGVAPLTNHEKTVLWRSSIWLTALVVCSWSAQLNELLDSSAEFFKTKAFLKIVRPVENMLRLIKRHVYNIMLPLDTKGER
mmetsp:Transcript_10670/g.39843  ORF Transcript_10670/g.39843 Transcript_10670/m.39843 type:complete len:685 (+) Transcript_10670:2111-4165(+)